MRRLTHQDEEWDVVLGRESWGSLLALFVPRRAAGPIRQTLLQANTYQAAERELAEMDEAALIALFERSRPKTT